MAEAYVKLLPRRPDFVLGWSMGGLVAWEMARSLGVPAVLVDAYPGELMNVDDYSRDPSSAFQADLAGIQQLPGPDYDRLLSVFTAHLTAIAEYRPQQQNLPVLLVTGAQDGEPDAVNQFWAARTADLQHLPLAGDHYALLNGYVTTLAEAIRGFPLERA
jgi:thioesterase domain-containing protein